MRNTTVFTIFEVLAVGCAGRGESQDFDTMTAAEHREAADREDRAADKNYARARCDLWTPPSPGGVGEGAVGVGPGADFYDPSWDPGEPEHYIVDERARVPGEK